MIYLSLKVLTKLLGIFFLPTPKVPKSNALSNSSKSKDKAAKIVRLLPLIPAYLSKKVLKKSKFFSKEKKTCDNSQNKYQTILCSSDKL